MAGFKHRHLAERVRGRDPAWAARLAGLTTGTSTVAHTWAASAALEAALDWPVAEAARHLRPVAAEVERIASHLGDLAQLAAATGLPVAQMDLLRLKARVLDWAGCWAGHRYLRGLIAPGGMARAPAADALAQGQTVLAEVEERARTAVARLDATASFLDRLHGAGRIPETVAAAVRPLGPVGRASGHAYDARAGGGPAAYGRRTPGWAAVLERDGDAWARYRVRVQELWVSLALVRRALADGVRCGEGRWHLPAPDPAGSGTGFAVVEGPRGAVAYAVTVEDGRVAGWTVATPSQRNWGVVPAAMANGNILQDFPIIDASFHLSVAGWDR
ncbi:MAG: hypothetical protein OWV35_10615 [Firmicutes bacterium]|nr:hypothetical protein [Bacillota bacterium]